MAVSLADVQHVAVLARLSLSADRAEALVSELNTILGHMDVLVRVNTEGVQEVSGVGAAGLPLRSDTGPAASLARAREHFGPRMEDGFFLVPRLSTHENTEGSS